MTRNDRIETQFGTGNFRDAGCEIAPSCLACPLPRCRYDREPEEELIEMNQIQERPSVNGTAAKPEDWTALAIRQLAAKIDEVRAVDELRAEAERIHKALSVYGVASLPALPWATEAPAQKRTPYQRRRCVRCGHEGAGQAFMMTANGRVCKRRVDCDARMPQEHSA